MRNFKNIIFVLIVIVFLLQMFVMKQDAKKQEISQKPLVAVSTFALYDISKHIAQDNVNVFMILPFGVSPHSFEPTPKLMIKINKSDLVIYSGAGLEPWIKGFDFKNKVINMSEHVDLKESNLKKHYHHHEGDLQKNINPHYWLDMQNMIKATNVITDELIKISPINKDLYNKNRNSYVKMLNKLDADYKSKLSMCKLDTIIVNHNAYSYLAQRYDFHTIALTELSPEAEPSATKMIELIKQVKKHNVSTVFFESFASDKAIKNIASEAKVSVEVFQPLGNITADETKQNLSFEDIMRINLEKLSKAMKCK